MDATDELAAAGGAAAQSGLRRGLHPAPALVLAVDVLLVGLCWFVFAPRWGAGFTYLAVFLLLGAVGFLLGAVIDE